MLVSSKRAKLALLHAQDEVNQRTPFGRIAIMILDVLNHDFFHLIDGEGRVSFDTLPRA